MITTMMGIVGTIILIPLAIVGLVIGFVRFAAAVTLALASAGIHRLTPHA